MSAGKPEPDPEERLEALSGDAGYLAPDLFTIYGVYHGGGAFLGWGMDFRHEHRAIYYDPYESSTHYANSAKDVLDMHNRIGTARLEWLPDA